jgi:DNA-binding CsgD family transcriptional regulator
MSKQGTAGKRKHVTLTIRQELETVRWLESGKSRGEVMALYNIGLSTVYTLKKQKDSFDQFGISLK